MATTSVALTETEKKDLTDQLIRILAQFPLVGTTINWTQLAADSIIEAFQAKGIDADTGLWPKDIDRLIEVFLTPETKGKSYTVARRIYFELAYFPDKRDAAQAVTVEAEDAAPSDATHEFAVSTRSDLDRGVFPLENTKLTEAEAVRSAADFNAEAAQCAADFNLVNSENWVVIARPKPEPWKIVSKPAKG